ncbi:hypothetical protein HK097_011622 [Rhizophlyctis rosea]|uniref:Secreted protein n=1 Tax=Rhizophlyctis rosea TaxID=64517 RepID=A0AAD5X8H7_9FUNG|nr:hypothetical protein HK097_011622 [Rhizophlyctis rosea]
MFLPVAVVPALVAVIPAVSLTDQKTVAVPFLLFHLIDEEEDLSGDSRRSVRPFRARGPGPDNLLDQEVNFGGDRRRSARRGAGRRDTEKKEANGG